MIRKIWWVITIALLVVGIANLIIYRPFNVLAGVILTAAGLLLLVRLTEPRR